MRVSNPPENGGLHADNHHPVRGLADRDGRARARVDAAGGAVSLVPDFKASADEIVRAVRSSALTEDEARRLVAANLGIAFAQGGERAIDMVREGLDIKEPRQ